GRDPERKIRDRCCRRQRGHLECARVKHQNRRQRERKEGHLSARSTDSCGGPKPHEIVVLPESRRPPCTDFLREFFPSHASAPSAATTARRPRRRCQLMIWPSRIATLSAEDPSGRSSRSFESATEEIVSVRPNLRSRRCSH